MTHEACRRTVVLMGTFVTIDVRGERAAPPHAAETVQAVERAFAWFRTVEDHCSRFDERSELMQLTARAGENVQVSAVLFEAVRFALAVAEETGGAFDPTIGGQMVRNGFDRNYRTGNAVRSPIAAGDPVSYRDVRLDPDRRAITLLRPLILDLGAVAKGLAIDMAARELQGFESFAIDAGGDLYLGGCRPDGAPWTVGIRHPRCDDEMIDAIKVSDRAVCTSGDYERRRAGEGGGHHILDPRTGRSANAVASVTVVAPTAMLADAVATAAFVLGPDEGIQLFDRLGVDGLILSAALEKFETRGVRSDYGCGATILQDAEGSAHDHSVGAGTAGCGARRHQPVGAGHP